MPAFVRFSDLISLVGDECLWSAVLGVLVCDTDSVCAILSTHTPRCTYVILKGIVQYIVVLMLVTHTINLSYTPCHICVCHGFV